MVGLVFRLASLLALVCAVFTATMDSIQSVSSSEVLLTSLGTAWAGFDAASLGAARALWKSYAEAWAGTRPIEWLLLQPTFAVFLGVSLVLWMIGYRKSKRLVRLTV